MQDAKPDAAARSQFQPLLRIPASAEGDPGAKGLSNPLDVRGYSAAWLALQCSRIRSAEAALLVVHCPNDKPVIVGWPVSEGGDDAWLGQLAEQAWSERKTIVSDARSECRGTTARHGDGAAAMAVAVPLGIGITPTAVVAVALAPSSSTAPGQDLSAIAEELRWGAGWLEALPSVQRSVATRADLDKTLTCLDMLAACSDQPTLLGTVMAIANELAARFGCDRVSIGRARSDGSVRLLAMSHSATFMSNARLVAAIEAAMEEASEQGAAASHPPLPSEERLVTMAQAALAGHAGSPTAIVLSLVIASGTGEAIGAITLERHAGPAFDRPTVQMCEAMAALLGPVISIHLRSNRLFAGRLVDGAQTKLAALLGPRRPGLKLSAIVLAGTVLFLALANGEHRVTARSVLEPEIQRAATAPFDGYIASAPVRAGDTVRRGETLASLDDRDLLIDRAKWTAERDKLVQRRREALAKRERSALAVLDPQLQQALSQLALVEERLGRARIGAPFDGVVISGDLSQMLGSPIEKGKMLFEIAPLDAYRLMVSVDERDIAFVAPGQKGMVALSGMPATPLPLLLTRVTPVTVAEDGRNTFRVEAMLTELDPRLRPGLEGVAKLDAGQRPLLWIWTRPLLDWMRLWVWKYLP